jgi:hypothetical protein
MKKLLIAILAILCISPAYADHGWGGRGGWRGGWGGDWIAPALVGGMIGYDLAYPYRYGYPYPYPYPAYEQAPVYVQPAPVYAPPSMQYWYYCASAKGYYPYVANCPESWQPVPARPPQ